MIPSRLKSRTVYKPFRRLFRADSESEREMMVQVAKLCVLHEDIMLEIHGTLHADDLDLGHANNPYKRVYFARRALATSWEVRQVVEALQRNVAFKERKRGFKKHNLQLWKRVVTFFIKNEKAIGDFRDTVAAKYMERAARFALREASESVDYYEVYRSKVPGLGYNLKLGLASTLLATAFALQKNAEEDKDAFASRTIELMHQAHAHAVFAARVIAVEFFYQA